MRVRRFLRVAAALIVLLFGCADAPGHHAEASRIGDTIIVPSGGDLQRAINDAHPGDVILLQPGVRYVGSFTLPRKSGEDWVTLTSVVSTRHTLPPAGTRVEPSDAVAMARVLAPSGSAFLASPGAHHYRFIGLEVAPVAGVFVTNLIDLGAAQTIDAMAHHFDFERCYIHGDPVKGSRRGIALNSGETTIVDSYVSDFKEVGNDSQAIAGWRGTGPFHIVNNFIQGAGENLMFGGGDPAIADLVPSDIDIERNTFSKPLAWRVGDPRFQGTAWSIKNLLELKNARRVRINGNILEYNWPNAQNGFAILFTVRNQDGGAPWSTIEDVTFSDNIVRHVAAGINVLGRDDIHTSQQARRITISNNLFLDVGRQWGMGRLFQLLNGTAGVTIDHNTGFQSETLVMGGDTLPHTGFTFQNNIAPHNEYGIIGSGTGVGKPTLDHYFPGAVVRRNVIAGGNPVLYPADNSFPMSLDDVKWVNGTSGNFRLAPTSPFHGRGTDGRDPGADLDAIQAAMTEPTTSASSAPVDFRDVGAAAVIPPLTGASLAPFGVNVTLASFARAVFWASLLLLFYAYVGYAAAIWILGRVRPRRVARRDIVPTVTVVVVAHNESANIERRISNLLALDYPRQAFEIVIASDGSTDDTVARASRFDDDRIRVIAFPVRRGKPAVLNAVIPTLRSLVVLLADARQVFDRGAVRALMGCLADPSVGAVSGELVLLPADSVEAAADGAAVYWNYEKAVRGAESALDSTVGATGAIYAIRRSLFEPIPEDTILDDVLIPLRVVRQGYRVLFEPHARAFDRVMPTAHQEFVRKVRTIGGNVQLFVRERWLLRPSQNRLFLQAVSHKMIRLLLPVLYLTLFAANLALATESGYQLALAAQAAFYVLALLAYAAPALRRTIPLLVIPYEICFLNWAAIVGTIRYVTNRQRVTWERPTLGAVS